MRLALSLIATILCGAPAFAESKNYSMADLDALAKSKSFHELVEHLRDIPPAQRNAHWNSLVDQTATGLMTEETDSVKKIRLASNLRKQFPRLENSPILGAKESFKELSDFELCYNTLDDDGDYCTRQLRSFVQGQKKNGALAQKAGALVSRKMAAWVSLEFFRIGLEAGEKAICTDSSLANSVENGFNQTEGEGLKNATTIARTYCWDNLKQQLVDALTSSNKDYQKAICPIALEKNSLKGLREAKCKELVKK